MGLWQGALESLMIESLPKEKQLLVVGGTGFIGRWVVLSAIRRGYQVYVLARNPPELSKKIDNVNYLTADIAQHKDVLMAIGSKRITHVINLGGAIDHAQFRQGGRDVIDSHFNGTLNLVQSLNWNYLKCFVQIGSSDEYGGSSAPQHEDQHCKSISSYSFAKFASSNFFQMLHKTEGFPVVILRLFLVYGPGQDSNRFLPQIISSCIDNKVFPVSMGEQLRDFCYVEDIVDGIFLALENNKVFGKIYNLGSGIPISIQSMVKNVVDLVGSGEPNFGAIPYRAGENMKLYGDITNAKCSLNWIPKIGIEDGLSRTINFYRKELSK
jgi:nucleoside-diphosphate-sugar epimerase